MKKEPFSLEKKIKELEIIEKYFQKPEMDLEEGIRQHREALKIAGEIKRYLETIESSLEKIDISENFV